MKHFIKRPFVSLAKHLSLWHQVVHHRSLLEMARQRVFVAGSLVAVAYLLICVRLVDVMIVRTVKTSANPITEHANVLPRADIVDRNGEILATHLVTASVYANPKVILNARDAAEKLAKLLPEIGFDVLYQRLTSDKGFVWIVRHIPPRLQQSLNHLGIPGVYLQKDTRRVYPYGPLGAHVLGYCGIDNRGLSGTEKFFDIKLLKNNEPLKLSLDIRIQHIVHDELAKSIVEFNAVAGNAMVMDMHTGELLAMTSLPVFDPNLPNQAPQDAAFNRNTLGVYEPGSTFKILNIAIALESGRANLNSRYDATNPVHIGRFQVNDFKGKGRVLTLSEAFVYSSNIASIKIALEFGTKNQKEYLNKFGIFKPTTVEIPEIGQPLIPATWRESTTMTVSYGYGISVTPLQVLATVNGIINNGILTQPTLLYKTDEQRDLIIQDNKNATPIVSEKTSAIIRKLMRIATRVKGKKADIQGYQVFGKTGTAYQAKFGKYDGGKTRTNTFIGAFPYNNPKYILIVVLDNPKANKSTFGYATAGWNSAAAAGKMIERMAPILGLHPQIEEDEAETRSPELINVNHVVSSPGLPNADD